MSETHLDLKPLAWEPPQSELHARLLLIEYESGIPNIENMEEVKLSSSYLSNIIYKRVISYGDRQEWDISEGTGVIYI